MRYLTAFFLVLFSVPVWAQITTGSDPLEISADTALEWNRNARTYTASGSVVAKKGDATVSSDTLTAIYLESEGASNISNLEAKGHVVIVSSPYKAYGDHGVYNVKTGDAVLTGENLRIETGNEYLTARDKIVFSSTKNTMTAYGQATAHKEGRTLTSDSLTAWFSKDSAGNMAADKITTTGGVTITTEKEKIQADRGLYDVQAQKAELTGHVRIFQGQSFLEGTRATVDMKTGVSRLFADDNAETQGRVKGVFYPKQSE